MNDVAGTTQSPRSEEFSRYVSERGSALLRMARSLTNSHADAEDLLQAALVKTFLPNAQTVAIRNNHQRISPEHLLQALLDDAEGMAAAAPGTSAAALSVPAAAASEAALAGGITGAIALLLLTGLLVVWIGRREGVRLLQPVTRPAGQEAPDPVHI